LATPSPSRTIPNQEVAGADEVLTEDEGLSQRELQDLLRSRRERQMRVRRLASAHDLLDPLTNVVEPDAERGERLRGEARRLSKES